MDKPKSEEHGDKARDSQESESLKPDDVLKRMLETPPKPHKPKPKKEQTKPKRAASNGLETHSDA